MEWLKKILEKATITEGVLDVNGIMESVNTEFPKHVVPKNEYNTVRDQLQEANTTISDLKKNNADNETLQNTINEHEKTIKTLQKQSVDQAKKFSLISELEKEGAVDADYLIYAEGGLEKFAFDSNNKPVGVSDVVKTYKESKPHLFKDTETERGYKPAGGKTTLVNNPWDKDHFNLTEQGKIYKESPEQAKQMMQAAGVQ